MAVELTKAEEETDWYSILRLESRANDGAISSAFRKLSLKWHPDKNQGSKEAEKKFMEVKEAKILLLDTKKRKVYDEKRNARLQAAAQLAEQYRNMGQKRRQLREELEMREKGVVSGNRSTGSGGLGAGGEARIVAELKKQGEEMRKRKGRERAQKRREQQAAMDFEFERASAGKREGNSNDDDASLEERVVRVKWNTRTESHSDHTLDVLFSQFGVVESVSIEVGSGNKALVTFVSSASADAAVANYSVDNKTMRVSYVGKKKRAKRNSFTPLRSIFTSPPATPTSQGCGNVTPSSLRDKESLVMMKLRQEAERQALIREMAADEGISLENGGRLKQMATTSRASVLPSLSSRPSGISGPVPSCKERDSGEVTWKEAGDGNHANNAGLATVETGEGGRAMGEVGNGVDGGMHGVVTGGGVPGGVVIAEQRQHAEMSCTFPVGTSGESKSYVTPIFPPPSPRTLAGSGGGPESDCLSAMKIRAAISPSSTPVTLGPRTVSAGSASTSGKSNIAHSLSMDDEGRTPPCISERVSPLDEGDILSRMMRFK